MSDIELAKTFISPKSGNVIVYGRIMYASFFTAVRPSKSETDVKRFQYGATILLPEFADLTALKGAVAGAFEAGVPAAKRMATKWRNPLKVTADEGSMAVYANDYPNMIRCNAKAFFKDGRTRPAPQVVDATGTAVSASVEAENCYNGRWARISLNPFFYPAGDGPCGVSLALVNVQLLRHDDPLAGGAVSAANEFSPVLDALDDFA